MKILIIFYISIFSIIFLKSAYAVDSIKENHGASAKLKNQLQDLLIWKISDELKLTPDQELKLSGIIKKINEKKSENNLKIDSLTKEVIKTENEKEKLKSYAGLKKAIMQNSVISLEELEAIKNLLGIKKLGKYLDVKSDISEKIKNIMAPNDKKRDKPLPPPKVIEE